MPVLAPLGDGVQCSEAIAALYARLGSASEEHIPRALWVAEHPSAAQLLDRTNDVVWARGHQGARTEILRRLHLPARELAAWHLRPGAEFVTYNPHADGLLREQYQRSLTYLFSTALGAVALLDLLDSATLGAAIGPWLRHPRDHHVAEALAPRDTEGSFVHFEELLAGHEPSVDRGRGKANTRAIAAMCDALADPHPGWQDWVRSSIAAWVTCSVDTRGVHEFVCHHLGHPLHQTSGGVGVEIPDASDAVRTLATMRHTRPGAFGDDSGQWVGSRDDLALICAHVPGLHAWLAHEGDAP